MKMNRTPLAGMLGCLLMLASCSGGESVQQVDATVREFSMHVLPESLALQGSGSFGFAVTEAQDSAVLEVLAEDASDLSHLYIEVDYDSSVWTPVSGEAGQLMEDAPLSLLAGGAGRLQYGQLYPGAQPEGVNGSGVLARLYFERRPEQAVRSTSAGVPRSAPAVTRFGQTDLLQWYYVNTGDYDQNGEVNIADLTPLGVNLGKSGPFNEGDALFMVDGDGNGEINLADITPIGINFGNSVDGFLLCAGEDGDGYPANPADGNGPGSRDVATIDFADAEGIGADRKFFLHNDKDVQLHDRYWARPLRGPDTGPAGAMSDEWDKSWKKTVVFTQDEQPSLEAPALAIIEGRPSILFNTGFDQSNVALFTQATDEFGLAWGPAVKVSGDVVGVTHPRMVQNFGAPAIAFGSLLNGNSYFRQASSADGTTWFDAVTVSNGSFFPDEMFIIEGQPAVIASDGFQAGVWIRNEDAASFSGYAIGLHSDVSAIVRNANELELSYHSTLNDSSYHGYLEFNGLTFEYTSSTLLTGDANINYSPSIFDFGGQLNMLLWDNTVGQYHLVQGAGGNSDVFTTPAQFLAANLGSIDQAQAFGRMWFTYLDLLGGNIGCSYSADGELSSLSGTQAIDELQFLVPDPEIGVVEGHPVVVYFDEVAPNQFDLVFAKYI